MSTVKILHSVSAHGASKEVRKCAQRPLMSTLAVFVADVLSLSIILSIPSSMNAFKGIPAQGSWSPLWLLLGLFLAVYSFFNLYPGISVSSVDEIRRTSLANGTVFLLLGVMLLLSHSQWNALAACLSCCAIASIIIPLIRTSVRRIGSQYDWWGYPVVLFGGGDAARSVVQKLRHQPQFGLRPVAIVTDDSISMDGEDIPAYDYRQVSRLAASGIKHAIVAAPELSQSEFAEMLERGRDAFPNIILIPDSDFIWKSGSYIRDFMGFLGLHLRNGLLSTGARVAKRASDLACATLFAILLSPIILVTALLIAAESGLPILYFQERLGKGGHIFRIWKFRTMVHDSENALKSLFRIKPELQKEWADNQKLRKDPRVTGVGQILRKTSLDELPQLWNVIKGDMSIVGPRPIIESEVVKYQGSYTLYTKTMPGITGLWQVSGRNNTTYADRVAYDTYYARNWSFWLDIYILARTIAVLITGEGAS